MSSLTQPVSKQSRPAAGSRSVKEWLDLLSTGECDQTQFLCGIGEVLRKAPDAGWELLGLIDQYYRRGKISAQMFGALKTHLQGLMVGTGNSDPVSAPPRMQDEPAPPAFTVAMAPPVSPAAPPSPARRFAPSTPTRPPSARASAPPEIPPSVDSSGSEAAPRSLAIGDVLRGRYVIEGLVGQGGMGTVYAATDQFRLDRSDGDQKVALKVLHTEIIKRPRLFAELRREFQHLQSLSHPNIVRVHEFDRDGDLAFFTMEFLSGALLSKVLSAQESAPLYRPYALAIIRSIGSAVAHAHARGVVHGDLNPGNVFVTDNGELRVLDFGASHQLHRGPWISEFADNEHVAVATRGFASCQVLAGEPADARDDVFALACMAYVLLAGDNPFRDCTALKARTLRMTPRRPRGLNGRQWNALRAGLNFERERRPADVREWLEKLELRDAAPTLPPLLSLFKKRPRPRGGVRRWLAPAALMVLAVAGWWLATNPASISAGQSAARQLVQSALAHVGTWQEWARKLAASRRTEPVIDGPVNSAPPSVEPATNLPLAPLAAQTKPNTVTNYGAERALAAAPTGREIPAARSSVLPQASPGDVSPPVRARIELAADNVEVPPDEPMARILVKRSRSLRGDVSFTWWTESGTAKAGRDFVPVSSHTEHMENGQSTLSLVVPLVVDPARRASRSFYVVIDEPSDNAALGSHTLTMVTMPGSDPTQDSAIEP